MKKEIQKLIELALAEKPVHQVLEIGVVEKAQANILNQYVSEDITGLKRILDTSGIRHAINHHGSMISEKLRAQIAINTDDFLLIPIILKKPDNIKYEGKNSLKQDVFTYTKEIDDIYFVVESVRFSKKKGNKLVFQTMFKKKKPTSKSWF